MKVGDKVYCKLSRNSYFKFGEFYTISDVNEYSVLINSHFFQYSEYDKNCFNFCEYFFTTKELRKSKLNQINENKISQ